MTYGDAARQVYAGMEGTEGTLSGAMKNFRTTNDPMITLHNGTIIVEENNTTRIMENTDAQGPQYSELTIEAKMYWDQIGYWLYAGIGTPVTANHSGETAVKDHTWKCAITRPNPMSFQIYNGLYWEQVLGAKMNTMDLTLLGDNLVAVSMKFMGRAATQISAPTPIADAPAAYSHPASLPHQSITVSGSAYAEFENFKISLNNNLKAQWTIRGSASMYRFKVGRLQVAFDGVAGFPAYASSFYEAYINRTTVGAIAVTITDAATNIGTVPSHPNLLVTIPKPLLMDTTKGADVGEVNQQVKGRAKYDTVTSSAATFVLTNEITSYVGS